MSELSEVAASGFLEVRNEHAPLFDSHLHMLKRDYEFHTVRLAECNDVQDQMHQLRRGKFIV